MNTVLIEKPYIQKNKLCCNIKNNNDNYNMWFEVENEYRDYLCDERADAFVIAILPYAVKHELDIKILDKISSKLYYQLTNILIPLLCKKFKKRFINIETGIDKSELQTQNAVGTGGSCGVDSFYTILKNANLKSDEFNLTYLTFFNAGASGSLGGDKSRELFNIRKEYAKKFAQENNYKFVYVDSNMNEFLKMDHKATHTFRSLACVLAIQKLFSKYYYASSGDDFDETKISQESTAYYDILNVQCLSTENIQFYSDGVGITRMEKIKEIVKHPETYEWLNVCIHDGENCGKCAKCIRTQLELESINFLEKYNKSFPLNNFYKNRKKYLAIMLSEKRLGDKYFLEVYRQYKKNGFRMPINSYILSYYLSAKKVMKKIIKAIVPKKIINKIKKNRVSYGWN